jgi:hypothetical protein
MPARPDGHVDPQSGGRPIKKDQASFEAAAAWRWRLHRLVAAGYPEALAAELAAEESLDVELACRLVAEGECPPELAARILL